MPSPLSKHVPASSVQDSTTDNDTDASDAPSLSGERVPPPITPQPKVGSRDKDLMYDTDEQDDNDSIHYNCLYTNTPVHKHSSSLLSGEQTGVTTGTKKQNSYRGFINLCIIHLVLTNLREMLVNLTKYGWLIKLRNSGDFLGDPGSWPMTSAVLCLNFFILTTFGLERFAASTVSPRRLATAKRSHRIDGISVLTSSVDNITVFLHWTLTLVLVCVPPALMATLSPSPRALFAVLMVMCYVVVMMKLVSYFLTNRNERGKYCIAWRREIQRLQRKGEGKPLKEIQESAKSLLDAKRAEGGQVMWPRNLSIGDMYYFIGVPTMCYEPHFPRTKGIRWGWLARRLNEFVLMLLLQVVIIEQYVIPLCNNAVEPMQSGDYKRILERWLKLSVPNLMVWLIGFYAIFHAYLNILGEVYHFAHRQFYLDWWNATTIDYFWRTWNLPVHSWMLRHVYKPLTRAGVARFMASFIVFFISAIFHEYVCAVSFRQVKGLAFMGMMMQIPLSLLTKKYTQGNQMGNVIFWLSIMMGQPLAVLVYYTSYKNG